MIKYGGKKFDVKGNIKYGSTDLEELVLFSSDYTKELPLRIETIGITHPDPKYFIERKHADYFIMEFVKSGEGYVICEGKEYKVAENYVYIIQPGMKHKYGSDKKNPYEKIWINFFSGVFSNIFSAYGLSEKIVFPNSNCGPLFEQLLAIAQTTNNSDEIYADVSEILFKIMLKLLKSINMQKVSEVAHLIKETLDSSIYRKITIEELTDSLNISKSQMCREFKKYYNITPYQYLLNRKISIAQNLLRTTKMSVREISELLHFADEYYFSNVFKNKTGFSPRTYRLEHIKK